MTPVRDRRLAVAAVAGVALVGAARLALLGWSAAAPDDARYLYVGLSVLDGHGAVTPEGAPFLLRSPVYGLALALGARLVGGDPLVGAHLVAATVTLAGLAGAVWIGRLLGGAPGAVGTGVALLLTPLAWELLPTLRVDPVQAAGVVGVLLALRRPGAGRWALAGLTLGVAILAKESVILLALLPLAWLGALPRRRWLGLTAIYLAAVAAVAAWWWIVVWAQTGTLFPLDALAAIDERGGSRGAVLLSHAPALVAWGIAWLGVAWRARRDVEPRLLLAAALLLSPPAAYAFLDRLADRNYAALATLSAIAVGTTAADALSRLYRRLASGGLLAGRPGRPIGAGAAALLGIAVVAVAGVGALAQGGVAVPERAELPARIGAWLEERLAPGERIAITFRERETVALRLYGRARVVLLAVDGVAPDARPGDYLWIGLRDGRLYGYRRAAWVAVLADPATRYLVLVGPHPLTPGELLPSLEAPSAASFGLRRAAGFAAAEGEATILEVEPARVAADQTRLPLHAAAGAALAWLELASVEGSTPEAAAARLLEARPVVGGTEEALAALLARLGDAACAAPADTPGPSGTIRLWPRYASGACGAAP